MLSSTNLLVFSFLIKIFSRKPIFTHIREQYGNETFRLCRGLEKDIIRLEKLRYDLRFLLVCKKEGLVPTFAKPKLSIDCDNRLRKEIAALIIKTELRNKHRSKNKLKEALRRNNRTVQQTTSFLLFHALRYQIRSAVESKRKKWAGTHQRKLKALREAHRVKQEPVPKRIRPDIIHNFSSYVLTEREIEVLSYSRDHYVPSRDYGKRIQVEFERFFQEILNHTDHIPAEQRTTMKTKFLATYGKYSKVKVTNEDKNILDGLYKNKDILILRQDKGRGVVIMNKSDYIDKSMAFLQGDEFETLGTDPTDSFQKLVQRTLLKMKNKFTTNEYKRLYPSASRPGLYFGMAKVHKLQNGSRDINQLPLRPVISNIGTATYEISKFLANLLQPIAKSEYTINSTKDFIEKLRDKNIEEQFEIVSFDVVSLFTSVPLDFTIELILDKIYTERLIKTKLKRTEMKTLLEMCTKDMHFAFDGKIYRQIDGVAMGSPLGPVIANVFMVELEKRLIPTMMDKIALWYRYVDDTFSFIRKGEVENVIQVLNSFHESIKFTFEKESDNSLSFLDVKVIKNEDGSFETDIHRKKTDTNVYMNWHSFAPKPWKIGTLKGLIRRAFTICSTNEYRDREIAFLKKVFVKINCFPSKVVNKIINDVKNRMASDNVETEPVTSDDTPINVASTAAAPTSKEEIYTPFISLPYKGQKGEEIIRTLKTVLKNTLPTNVIPRFTYKGKKLGSFFRIKDKVPVEHQTQLVYAFNPAYNDEQKTEYIGETKVRYGTRTHEHCFTDKASAVYKHKTHNNFQISEEDFEILDKGFAKTLDRKLAEALYIKEMDPVLNRQKKCYNLSLFN